MQDDTARLRALLWGLARKAAGEEQALIRRQLLGLKWQDVNYGILVAGQASGGAAPAISRCEMPSRLSASGNDCRIETRTSELSVPFAAVANCPAAKSCSSMAAVGTFALEALRAWACA